MMGVIRDGFARHGITTQIYAGNLPSECEYHLSYMRHNGDVVALLT
jgi:hypothetical protein